MKGLLYILDGHEPVPCEDPVLWASWTLRPERRVGLDRVGPVQVSTVFLGVDHNWSGTGAPLLFETMVFGPHGGVGNSTLRYATWDEALAGHREVVARLSTLDHAGPSVDSPDHDGS